MNALAAARAFSILGSGGGAVSATGSASAGLGAISVDAEDVVSREEPGEPERPSVAAAGGAFDATCVGGAGFFAVVLPRFSTGGPVSVSSIAWCLGVAAIRLRSTPSLDASDYLDGEAVASS